MELMTNLEIRKRHLTDSTGQFDRCLRVMARDKNQEDAGRMSDSFVLDL